MGDRRKSLENIIHSLLKDSGFLVHYDRRVLKFHGKNIILGLIAVMSFRIGLLFSSMSEVSGLLRVFRSIGGCLRGLIG